MGYRQQTQPHTDKREFQWQASRIFIMDSLFRQGGILAMVWPWCVEENVADAVFGDDTSDHCKGQNVA